ncbi:MAG TPA: hypothetical protein VFA22_09915 [Stellaceae bacterium]|nr:hypothetical protein [Stellaceae bacterium]
MDLMKLLSLLQGAQDGSEYLDYAIQRVLFRMTKPVPLYTRSLDAALALIPEGWTLHRLGQLSNCRGGSGGWVADIYRPSDAVIPFPCEGTAQSAALALCIAGVRTRIGLVAQEGEAVQRSAV